MASIVPTVGRVVLFTMNAQAAREINQRRRQATERYHLHQHERNGTQLHVGNEATEGKVYAADIVAVWGNTPDSLVNLKVKLDGNDDYWATSVKVEDEKKDPAGQPVHTPGTYHWMDYQKGQAAKAEALEAKLAKDREQP